MDWRQGFRAVHRDLGYIVVSLTIAYALSGIAVNHIDDWNPNYRYAEEAIAIGPVPAGSLAEQDSALGSDPGGWGPQPGDTGTEPVDAPAEADASAPSEPQGSETPSAEVTTPAEAPAYPDGEPTKDWTRKQLDAYAADKLELDTTKLESKAAVLAAINAPKE